MGWFQNMSSGGMLENLRGRFKGADPAPLSDDPLERALQQHRFGQVVRAPELWRKHPDFRQALRAAVETIDDCFCLVPDGSGVLTLCINNEPDGAEQEFVTNPYLLASRAVTNGDYQRFVDAGAYDDHDLWPEEVWPHLINFRDQTNHAGPRYWREGRHDRRLARHPVVGISWYEAAVYAAWAGYRLPTEAEWQVAASWQLGSVLNGRRYPWGDALDLECCNIWASGHAHTLPVDACPGGATPNGILQLVGNTWEWVQSDFHCTDEEGREIVGETEMKGIRGGAFDTYFAWQATSTFRSGLPALTRVHNVGFRCALDLIAET